MTEPVHRWEPVTDLYKEQPRKAAEITTESQKKIQELHESNRRRPRIEAKAPLGIRIFTWYYFCRAGVCLLLLLILGMFPKSSPSIWLFDSVGSFLHIPGSKGQREARSKEIEKMAQTYAVPQDAIADEEPEFNSETMRNIVIAYLVFSLVAAGWVGFMWWNRSWRVRWITMFYSGALVAKVAINLIAGAASGVASGIDSSQTPALVLALGFNGLVFLYLAFWPDVEHWFETES